MFQRRVRVFYPLRTGRMVLRTENDWQQDVEPLDVQSPADVFEFDISGTHSTLDLKPCIRQGDRLIWSHGANKLVVLSSDGPRDIYPFFEPRNRSDLTSRIPFHSQILGRHLELRIYKPAGYDENFLKRYPVIYMHDGRNLFFPEEAFTGREWQVDETMDRLDAMNLIDQCLVVGIHTSRRMEDYSRPGYEAFGRALTEELKPMVDRELRTLPDSRNTTVMGSSMGGVLSFFLAWQFPQVFGNAACLSSTFGRFDDLIHRVRTESLDGREDLRFYLDSGWPNDNYEATLGMAHALTERGFSFGRRLLHFAFPFARHNEPSWAARCHLPIQLFSGRLANLDRR